MAVKRVHLLDLHTMPEDPVERIFWLDGVLAKVQDELTELYADAYFEARIEGRFDAALKVGKISKTRALKMTRQRNEQSGRSVRWADGADPTSTAYSG